MAETPRRRDRAAAFLALTPGTAGLLAMAVLVGMGERMAERFLPLYLLALGGGAMAVGLLQAMDTLLSALYSFPGGYLADRLGAKRSLTLFNLVAMAGFAMAALASSWPAVLAGAALYIAWSAVSLPATMGLLYAVLPEDKRTMGVTVHSLVKRIPMALGPLAGGACIAVWGETAGVRIAFCAALVFAAIGLALQRRWMPNDRPRRTSDACGLVPEKNPLRLYRRMPRAMKGLLLSDILIRFCEQIPYAFVVIWCMQAIAKPVSALEFGLLTGIEMVTAMLIGIPVAALADRTIKKPFVLATFVFFTLFPAVLYFCQSFWLLVPAFVLRGLKEFGEPTRKSLIMDLSPADCRGGMFGLYYLIRDVAVSLAALLGAWLWMFSPGAALWTAFGFGVVGTAWFALRGEEHGGA